MAGTAFELGPRVDLTRVEPMVIGAFVGQRQRLLDTVRGLADDEWQNPTRCSEWNARELIIHVLGATDACRSTLTGEHAVFGGSFDPNSSPNAFVLRRAGEPIATTLNDLEDEITRANVALDAAGAQDPTLQVTAVWGESVDWRLFVTHMFWDSWIHERDLLVPLGREPETMDTETRLAAAYSLHCSAIMLGLLGCPLDVTLRLDGIGAATYRTIVGEGSDVRVSVSPLDHAGPVNGSTVAVTDAIAGRGAELAEVLDAPVESVDALAQVGSFLRGQTAPPSIP